MHRDFSNGILFFFKMSNENIFSECSKDFANPEEEFQDGNKSAVMLSPISTTLSLKS